MMTSGSWKNKQGTSERKCRCGSWQKHWEKFSKRRWPTFCSVLGCFNHATLGAHVTKILQSEEYIIPMCESCNKRQDIFPLKMDAFPQSANKSQTCD